MPDPFPNELVEAAAQALFDEWCHLSGEPLGEWRESGEPAVWDSYAKRVLAAVLPLIEQRVIDRLAREAARASMTDPFPNEQKCEAPHCWSEYGTPCGRCPVLDPFPNELVEAAAKAAMEAEPGQNWECATAKEADVYLRDAVAVLAAVLPLIEQRVSRDAYPQAWRYGAAEENARIVAALRAKGTHAADVLADQIEMEAP